jgi:glutathione S-transferase
VIELWQFNLSMYPEIVRWALDHKGLAYRTRDLLPGPHVLQLLPRFGQKTVPVLRDGDHLQRQTLEILADLEQRYAQCPLLSQDSAQAAQSWTLARRFADELGPQVRLAAFHELLPHAAWMARIWSQPFAPLVRAAYIAGFPLLVRPVMRADMGITAARAEAARAATATALDWIAQQTGDRDYLVGDRFGLADLVVAATMFPVVLPPEYPAVLPQPYPRGARHWLARWRGHPGAMWVQRIYAVHRRRAALP